MRGAMKKLAALVVAISLAVACGPGGPDRASLPTQPTVALSNEAFSYLNNILVRSFNIRIGGPVCGGR